MQDKSVLVWDLPTRLCHWSLALATITACLSAELDGDAAMRLHFLSGYAVLALVGFRALWGIAGARYARFSQFVRGPATTLGYALSLLRGSSGPSYPGHNPLGALSVIALLAVCGLQAASGLMTRDEVASEGPLARSVSEAMVHRCSALHDWGETAVYALVALHLSAIAYYRLARRENLVLPMLTGRKHAQGQPGADDGAGTRMRALFLMTLSVALVAWLVNLG